MAYDPAMPDVHSSTTQTDPAGQPAHAGQGMKLAIVGAGGVGATIAYACLIRGVADEMVLYDINLKKAQAEAEDLRHGLPFVAPAQVEGTDDVRRCAGASVVIITAGARQKPGETRLDLAERHVELFRQLVPTLIDVAPLATYLVVSNPVDVLTQVTLRLSGLKAEKVIGSGTVLDSARFRSLIAQRLRVAAENVHAYVAGEHGDSEIPLWSSATVGNVPLRDWAVMGHGRLDVRSRTEITQSVKTAATRIIEGKGATTYGIGLSCARIVEALGDTTPRVLPVSALIGEGEIASIPELAGVCLSVPRLVGGGRVEVPLPLSLSENEAAGLRNSGEVLREAIARAGF